MANPSFPQVSDSHRPVENLAVAALILWSGATAFGFEGPPEVVADQVKTELITEHASIQPGGTTRIGVQFAIEDGWHIYAQEPGDAGLPTQITWTSSSHWVQFGPLQWPKPQRFLDPGDITTFGYSGAVVLHSTLTRNVPEIMDRNIWPTNESQVQIRAEVKWLACKAICIPGSATLSLTLPVSTSPPVFSAHAQLFEHIQN